VLVVILDVLLALMRPDRALIEPTPAMRRVNWKLHRDLLEAIRKKDAEKAAALAVAHAKGRKQELVRATDRIVKRPMRLQREKAL